MSELIENNFYKIILQALDSLGKVIPESNSLCLYRSGILDSAEMMQFILEIELETGKRMDLSKLMEKDISIDFILDELERCK